MPENIKKYPRTFHLSFSKGCTNDDKMLDTDDYFLHKEIIITSKLDGSNFCITNKECFARSHNGPPTHKSFDWAKAFHNQIKFTIPDNLIIYAEYLFAKHSIHYNNLPHYLFVFNILDLDKNEWLSWKNLEKISQQLSIPTVPILYKGIISSNKDLQNLCLSLMKEKEFEDNEREGVVIRTIDSFKEKDFDFSIGKMVRFNHVQTSDHWKHQEIVKNKLKI
jgi:hypothetical protein